MEKLQHKTRTYKKQIEDAEEIAALNLAKFRKAQQQLEEVCSKLYFLFFLIIQLFAGGGQKQHCWDQYWTYQSWISGFINLNIFPLKAKFFFSQDTMDSIMDFNCRCNNLVHKQKTNENIYCKVIVLFLKTQN